MRLELQDVAALAGDAEIVDENPHPDAAIGGVQQAVSEQMAARVALPDEVLDVERDGRFVRERKPRRQRELVAIEQPVRRLAAAEHGFDAGREVGE